MIQELLGQLNSQGWSDTLIAARLGVSQAAVYRWRKGQKTPPIADINATVDWLRNHSSIDKAAVPHYGGNIFVKLGNSEKTPFELTSGINCPILFHFGEIDANPSQEDMKKLDAELTRLGKRHQFYTYSGTNHGFMDFTGARHHQEAAEAAWPRTLEFLAQHLKGAAVPR